MARRSGGAVRFAGFLDAGMSTLLRLTALLFSLGLSQREIAHLRSVTYPAVNKTLEDIKMKLNFYSLNSLLAMFQVRLFIFILKGSVIKNIKK